MLFEDNFLGGKIIGTFWERFQRVSRVTGLIPCEPSAKESEQDNAVASLFAMCLSAWTVPLMPPAYQLRYTHDY